MKKSLVALAALAAVGAASAQSSVTLYGTLDVGYGSESYKFTAANGDVTKKDTNTGVIGDTRDTSVIGLRGSDDLGNGLSAVFNLEGTIGSSFRVGDVTSALGVATPAPTIVGAGISDNVGVFGNFRRRATVGIASPYGTVELGRRSTPLNTFVGDTTIPGDFGTQNIGLGGNVSGDTYMLRNGYNYPAVVPGAAPNTAAAAVNAQVANVLTGTRQNGVTYTGNFGGVGVAVQWGQISDKVDNPSVVNANGKTTGAHMGLSVSYGAGPLLVGGALQQATVKVTAAGATAAKVATNAYAVGATYDLGVAKIYANYIDAKSKAQQVKALSYTRDGRDSELNVGATMPLGGATLVLGVSRDQQRIYDAADQQVTKDVGTQVVLGADYAFGKRTDAYVRVKAGTAKYKDVTAAGDVDAGKANLRGFVVGLRHNF